MPELLDPDTLQRLIPHIIGQVQSNENGSYCFLPDGRLIAWGTTDEATTSVAASGLYRTDTQTHAWPTTAWLDPPKLVASPVQEAGNPFGHYATPSGTNFLWRGFGLTNATRLRLDWVARGRWK